MDTHHSVFQSAKKFICGTLFSRVSGLIRDMVMAFCFGSSIEIASFMVAYRFANLFRRLLGEGNLQAGFIPHFEALRAKNHVEAFAFYRDATLSFATLTFLLVLSMEAILYYIASYLHAENRLIAHLTLWMMPSLIFICLSSLNHGLLQCQKKYFAPAIAPLFFNIVWSITAFCSYRLASWHQVVALSLGIVIAFIAQWGFTVLRVHSEMRKHVLYSDWPRAQLFSVEWRNLIKPMALGIIGVGATQVNSTFDAIFAKYADPSGPAYLWYAIRVEQLPLALFALAFSGALLPPLSRAIQEADLHRYKNLLTAGLRQAATFFIPAFFGLLVLGASGLNLLYGRGSFTDLALRETLFCLWAYSFGLIPSGFVVLLSVGFFAKKKYATPTAASLIAIGIHFFLNAYCIVILHWGAVSVACATSVSAWCNCFFLLYCHEIDRSFWRYFTKLTALSCVAALSALLVGYYLGDATLHIWDGAEQIFTRSFSLQSIQFALAGCTYFGVCFVLARWLGWKEITASFFHVEKI